MVKVQVTYKNRLIFFLKIPRGCFLSDGMDFFKFNVRRVVFTPWDLIPYDFLRKFIIGFYRKLEFLELKFVHLNIVIFRLKRLIHVILRILVNY